MILAIDPGLTALGWAFFNNQTLKSCGISRTKETALHERIKDHIKNLHRQLRQCQILVIEKPEVYSQRFLKGDPRDLVNLGILIGGLIVAADCPIVHMVYPKRWKGQIPKEIHGERILGKLTAAELGVLTDKEALGEPASCPESLLHNVIDAIGIGLWHKKRITS